MSRVQLVALFVRLAGLVWLLSNWEMTILLPAAYLKGGSGLPFWAGFVFLLVALVKFGVGGFLCLRPLSVVRIMTPGEVKSSDEEAVPTIGDIQTVLFVCLGLYFAIPAFLSLLSPLYGIVTSGSPRSILGDPQTVLFRFVAPVLRFAIGIWLILGARGLMNVVNKLRTSGTGDHPV
nr:hypothetical protein [uncultured Cohaesibacter sp.]